MKIVICLAGLSSRFRKAGFIRPKYELDLAGQPILERVLSGFDRAGSDVSFTLVSLRSNDLSTFCGSIAALRERVNNGQIDLVELPKPTRGQAETVAEALLQRPEALEHSLVVFNGDTIYRDWRQPADAIRSGEGYLDVTSEDGNRWSFVRLADERDRNSRVIETAEKRRISDNCSTGLYAFRSGRQYLNLFHQCFESENASTSGPDGEYYIAPMYNKLVNIGEGIRVHDIGRADVAFVGTPEEYHTVNSTWAWD